MFVGLVGHCYGSSPTDNPTSYTEQEFDLATTLGRPRLMLVASDEFKLPANLIEPEEKRQRQAAFRARVLEERVVAMFDDPAGLAGLVTQALANWRASRENGRASSCRAAKDARRRHSGAQTGGGAPDRAPRDQGDAELHRPRGRAGVAA